MIPAERVEKAALELWKLERDCGASRAIIYSNAVRDVYERKVVTVLRHVGVDFESPPRQLDSGKSPGGCARGYCRSQPACPAGTCRAIC